MLARQFGAEIVRFFLLDVETGNSEIGVVMTTVTKIAVKESAANVIGV